MNNLNKIENPNADEKVCFSCKYMLWLVGVGQGVKCEIDKKDMPSRFYTCDKFDFKIKKNE